MKWLVRLYPRAWRERYAEEFDALLEDARPGWRGVVDVFVSALRMRAATADFRLVVSLGLIGAAVACVLALREPRRFVSEGAVRIQAGSEANPEAFSFWIARMNHEILSRTSLAGVIHNPQLNLYAAEQRKTPIEDVIESMRTRDLHVAFEPSTDGRSAEMRISFAYPDPAVARATVSTVEARFIENQQLARRIYQWTAAGTPFYVSDARTVGMDSDISVSRSPTLPREGIREVPVRFGAMGAAIGVGIGLMLFFARRQRRGALVCGAAMAVISAVSLYFTGPYESIATLAADSSKTLAAIRPPGVPNVRIEALPPGMLRVVSRGADGHRAQKSGQAAVTEIARSGAAVEIVDPPSLPMEPIGLKTPWRWWFFGAGVALMLSAWLVRAVPFSFPAESFPRGR